MFGERIPVDRHHHHHHHGDDSPDATHLINAQLPTACPTCGSFTRPADNQLGWRCENPSCSFSGTPLNRQQQYQQQIQ
jgi:NAD-dependent DNA ligase